MNNAPLNMWTWLAVVAAALVAYGLYRSLARRPVRAAVPDVSDAADKSENPDKCETLAPLILPFLEYFEGSMNALYTLVCNPDTLLGANTFENIAGIFRTRGPEQANAWFSTFCADRETWNATRYGSKATEMMQILKACGIREASAPTGVWAEELTGRYTRLGPIAPGAPFHILAPCWLLGGAVFEKGLAAPSTSNS